MSAPSSSTRPVTHPPTDSSCIRLRHRSRVLLPHPDGPMMAVTVWAGNRIDTSVSTARGPNSAVSRAASTGGRASAGGAMTLRYRAAGGEGEHEHERHQHERGRPGEAVPLVERTGRVHVDLQRQGLHRLQHVRRKVEIAERREQQGRRLAGDARDPHQAARHDAGERRAGDDAQRRAPARGAEGERRLAQRMGDEADHRIGGASGPRNDEGGERHAPRERGEVAHRLYQPGPSEDPDHDGGGPVQHVGHESHQPPETPGAVLGEVQSRADADREPDERREPHDDSGADDGVRNPTARFSRGDRVLGEEALVERRRTLGDEVTQDEHEGEHRGERQRGDEARHEGAREAAAQPARAQRARLPAAVPRATRQIKSRASPFTTTVITNRMRPTSNSADRYSDVVASLNSFAMAAAMVYAGWSTESPMSWRFPITIVTAIGSPRARPRPRMTAPMSPARP